tara:strand:+ start:135 stop:284 length:150 start_codon:yes stop_codon:yes gene_type:complete
MRMSVKEINEPILTKRDSSPGVKKWEEALQLPSRNGLNINQINEKYVNS